MFGEYNEDETLSEDDKKPYDKISSDVKGAISQRMSPQSNPEDDAIRAQAKERQDAALFMQALSPLSSGYGGDTSSTKFYDSLAKRGETDVKMLQERDLKRAQVEESIRKQMAAEALKRDQMAQAKEQGDLNRQLRGDIGTMNADLRRSQLGVSQELQRQNLDLKKKGITDSNLQKLEKRLAPVQDAMNQLGVIEGMISNYAPGFTLEDAQKVNGKLMVNGKEVDLPGVSVPGLGRMTALFGTEARDLDSAAQKLLNVVLKDRSGAVVTTDEMERIKKEFKNGQYNTEAELIDALKLYKNEIKKVAKNRAAGFDPEVLDKYEEGGGYIPNRDVKQAPAETTRIVGGVTYQKVNGGWKAVE